MKTLLKPRDLIAIACLVLVMILVYSGQEKGVSEIIIGIVGYYFGHRSSGVDGGT